MVAMMSMQQRQLITSIPFRIDYRVRYSPCEALQDEAGHFHRMTQPAGAYWAQYYQERLQLSNIQTAPPASKSPRKILQ
jgi:hypothetical protein